MINFLIIEIHLTQRKSIIVDDYNDTTQYNAYSLLWNVYIITIFFYKYYIVFIVDQVYDGLFARSLKCMSSNMSFLIIATYIDNVESRELLTITELTILMKCLNFIFEATFGIVNRRVTPHFLKAKWWLIILYCSITN